MKPLLWRASLRHLRRHPWQLSLATLGVGLGVAVMIAIDVASGSAQRAFELSSSTLTGRATHSVEGGAEGLPAETYKRIRLELGIRPAAPIVESYVDPRPAPRTDPPSPGNRPVRGRSVSFVSERSSNDETSTWRASSRIPAPR